ncbi:MAG: hypothetical protein ACRCTE_11510 [Cellulosilyticaceae bacterium]
MKKYTYCARWSTPFGTAVAIIILVGVLIFGGIAIPFNKGEDLKELLKALLLIATADILVGVFFVIREVVIRKKAEYLGEKRGAYITEEGILIIGFTKGNLKEENNDLLVESRYARGLREMQTQHEFLEEAVFIPYESITNLYGSGKNVNMGYKRSGQEVLISLGGHFVAPMSLGVEVMEQCSKRGLKVYWRRQGYTEISASEIEKQKERLLSGVEEPAPQLAKEEEVLHWMNYNK